MRLSNLTALLSLFVLLPGAVLGQTPLLPSCAADSTLPRATVRATIALAPPLRVKPRSTEALGYLLLAQAIAQHFVPPDTLDLPLWPGTFCTFCPTSSSSWHSPRPDFLGLSGQLLFAVDSAGQADSSSVQATSTSVLLNAALLQALHHARAAGEVLLPRAPRQKRPTTASLDLLSSTDTLPGAIPLVAIRLIGLRVDSVARRVTTSYPVYPPAADSLQVSDTVLLEFIIDTIGRVVPWSLRLREGQYREFIEEAIKAVLRATYAPARTQGCSLPLLVQQRVAFRHY